MRLSPKGLHRWYAQCCKTPLASTVPLIPFAGVARCPMVTPYVLTEAERQKLRAHPRA